MKHIDVKTIEKLTEANPTMLAEEINVPKSTMYDRAKNGNWIEFYKFALIGFRISKSKIPLKEIFRIIKTLESVNK